MIRTQWSELNHVKAHFLSFEWNVSINILMHVLTNELNNFNIKFDMFIFSIYVKINAIYEIAFIFLL